MREEKPAALGQLRAAVSFFYWRKPGTVVENEWP
jgi:hypothetical protein